MKCANCPKFITIHAISLVKCASSVGPDDLTNGLLVISLSVILSLGWLPNNKREEQQETS